MDVLVKNISFIQISFCMFYVSNLWMFLKILFGVFFLDYTVNCTNGDFVDDDNVY